MHQQGSLIMKIMTILLLLTPVSIFAANQVYKWVDDKGEVHYSSSPPSTSLNGTVRHDTGDMVIFKPQFIHPSESTVSREDNSPDNPQLAIYCQNLKNNLSILYKNKRVRVRQANGQFIELDNNAKEQKVAEVHSTLQKYCDNKI